MSIVTLDDRDGSISYAPSGNWGQMGVKEENAGTTSYTTKAGSTITIPFTGMNSTFSDFYIYATVSSRFKVLKSVFLVPFPPMEREVFRLLRTAWMGRLLSHLMVPSFRLFNSVSCFLDLQNYHLRHIP